MQTPEERILNRRASSARWRAKNLEKAKAKYAIWYDANREKKRKYTEEYRKKHPKETLATAKRCAAEYYKKNPEKIRAARALKYATNKEEIKAKVREFYNRQDPEYRRVYWRAWRETHRGAYAASRAKRRALLAMPTDANPVFIEAFYVTAARISQCLGIKHHVDHVRPISKGGLHHERNLQVLPARINLRKNDKLAA